MLLERISRVLLSLGEKEKAALRRPFRVWLMSMPYLMKGISFVYFMKTMMSARASILLRKISGSFF